MSLKNVDRKLNVAEQGKLWAAYMGNSMAICVLNYILHHVDDRDIRDVVKNGLNLTEQFVKEIQDILNREKYPIPIGFTEDDVNVGAPRLFADEFYLHYLKYVGKAGISIYGIAVPLMVRPDIRDFFTKCIESTVEFMNQVNKVLISKGFITEPAQMPYPNQAEFVKKQSYLNGLLRDNRPLHALEITHLHENIENNAVSKAILIGFSQVAELEQVKEYFLKGKEITTKHYDAFTDILTKENIPSPPIYDTLVTTSTAPPFSDKLMMAHKLDMFSMRIRTYGNALAFCANQDVSAKYARFLVDVGTYAEAGAKILIDHAWLEQLPQAPNREAIVKS